MWSTSFYINPAQTNRAFIQALVVTQSTCRVTETHSGYYLLYFFYLVYLSVTDHYIDILDIISFIISFSGSDRQIVNMYRATEIFRTLVYRFRCIYILFQGLVVIQLCYTVY